MIPGSRRPELPFRTSPQFPGKRRLGNLVPNQLFNPVHLLHIGLIDQRDGHPRCIGPCCTANPVHIILRVSRHIIIDHQVDVLDVNSPAQHIGRYQHPCFPRLETQQNLFSLSLLQIRGNSFRFPGFRPQTPDNLVDLTLGRGENQNAP